MRYVIAGISTGVCLPMIEAIGVGWVSTIAAGIQIICTLLVVLTTKFGKGWRES
jgi:hypothetical protein